MNYGNLSQEALDVVVEEDYQKGDLTLKEVLDDYGEDILFADYKVASDNSKLRRFVAWSEQNIYLLHDDGMFSTVIQIPRNPPNVQKS